jgi:hypothetical protein
LLYAAQNFGVTLHCLSDLRPVVLILALDRGIPREREEASRPLILQAQALCKQALQLLFALLDLN